MTYECGFATKDLNSILDAKKLVEGRLAKGKFLDFKEGDKIVLREDIWKEGEIIESIPNRGSVRITTINKYDSFQQMLLAEGVNEVIPYAKNFSEALDSYYRFYTPEDEKKYGVLAIRVALSN